ncbi:C2 and GRAM domain-containing protein [Acorus gramineus]|uniref:C2 and GRAM domain-containing protein n=1 Tax=Acorus gramineus TaxID=55184 RepID=A0AAV9ARX9_ACOGR|nr:C2 and GRAM domain-containing protein [Acorus gramineus]
MMMQRPLPPEEYSLRETSPHLGGVIAKGDKLTSTYDLIEQMQYLYVRVVKARDLPAMDVTGSCDPYVEVKLGNYKGTTPHFVKKTNPEWNQVFAFSKDRIQASVIEVTVKDKDFVKDDFIGRVSFDLTEVPKRVPPDSPLAPQWYRLEDKKGDKAKSELMLAVWMGTQADEAFPEAWHSDAAAVPSEGLASIRSKVYLSPKLWYVRVNIIEAQDLLVSDKGRYPEVLVKAVLGNQALRTRVSPSRNLNPMWNEDLMFVAAEPFEEHLVLSVEDRVGPKKDEVLGKVAIPLQNVERRLDYRAVNTKWYNLERHVVVAEGDQKKETTTTKFSSRIHLRICLDGGYHVLDESTHYSSDLRPTAKQLWKSSIGVLEVGILTAQGLLPMKTKDKKGTTDAYCVAKYGQKWIRTRTIIDCFAPKWNEQYTWEVFDPCTVVTVGVFDNCHLQGGDKATETKDSRIGKVRIRLSTLETDRVYTHSYPLLVLHPSGVKKMGEVQLAVRFTRSSLLNMLYIYSLPLLPKMHYLHPLSVTQLDNLRHQATQIVSMRLARAEPPLRKEVVEYMLDVDSHMWSMRKSKANFFRIMGVLGGLIAVGSWFDQVRNWKNPLTTVLVHVLFIILVLYPELILPTAFLYLFLIGIWYYRRRPRQPPHMDTRLSHADAVHPDELDEEFDTFPTSRPPNIVRMRYDRLRSVAGRIQTVVGDLATQGERLQSLLSWRDPRATALFMTFCLVTAIVLYVTPFRVVALVAGIYALRHPRFRRKLPSAPLNFFRRLPARTDSML